MANNKIFVFGASGHAKVVIDILERLSGTKVVFAVDDATRPALCGYDVINRDTLLARRPEVSAGIVTIGANATRCDIAAWLAAREFKLASAIHPASILARRVAVGEGTVIMAGCVVNSDTAIGASVIVNTGATIDHDCTIGDGVHIAPGCHLCGGVTVGARSFIGAGTIVIPGVRIGNNALIGAGSTVTTDVSDGARIAGAPARPLARAK